MEQNKINFIAELWKKHNYLSDGYGYVMQEKNFWKAFEEYDKSFPVEAVVMQNADIGIDVRIPERIGWTEFTKESIIFHYSTKDEYENCTNTKITGIKLSVSA